MWQAYLHMNQHLYAALEDQLAREGGVSGADYKVLVPLSEEPAGVLRARELGAEIGWDRSRLSHHISRMEKRGLVTRERRLLQRPHSRLLERAHSRLLERCHGRSGLVWRTS